MKPLRSVVLLCRRMTASSPRLAPVRSRCDELQASFYGREVVVSRCLMLMEDGWFFGKKGRDFGLFFKKSRIFGKNQQKL